MNEYDDDDDNNTKTTTTTTMSITKMHACDAGTMYASGANYSNNSSGSS